MQTATFVKMAISAWQAQNKRVDDLIGKYSDDQWKADTAPGRNSGTYLLGHLTAVNDGMLTLLGFGDKLHPELEDIFLKNPDKSGLDIPSLDNLKKYWKEVNTKLDSHIAALPAEDWFTRHSAVSEEDFVKEPHRNKLNILLSRTNHQAYHLGQLAYLG
jgi:uncharacterized damage-inducible protein DinB